MRARILPILLAAASLPGPARSAIAQTAVQVDDRVRVWPTIDQHYAARVLVSWYPDSLAVLRSDSAWRPASARTNTVQVAALTRLDLARGNQWKLGVLGGLIAAVGTGIVVGATQEVEDLSGLEVGFLTTALTAIFTLPVGALVGSFYPRWQEIR